MGSRLTLNLGVRYFWLTPFFDAKKPTNDSIFVPALYSSSQQAQLDSNGNLIPGTQRDAIPTSGSGNQFKYDPKNNQYIFTVASGSLPLGPVQLQANLHDGSALRTINVVVTP